MYVSHQFMISTTIHERALTLHTWDPEPWGQISADPDQETSAPGTGGPGHLIHVPIPSMLGHMTVTWLPPTSHGQTKIWTPGWVWVPTPSPHDSHMIIAEVIWESNANYKGCMNRSKVDTGWVCECTACFSLQCGLCLVSRVNEMSTLRQVCKFPWQ